MNKITALLFAAGLTLGVATSPASASNFDLGTLSSDTTGFVANFGTGIQTFSDQIAFSLTGLSTSLVGSISDVVTTFLGAPVNSVNFVLDLFSVGDPVTSLGHYEDLSGTGIAFNYADLAAGDYFFRITGSTAAGGNFYSYKFAVTETPIPPALLLFGTALGGMGIAAYRKRKAAAAQA
nr:hypothetical protein [uncultured Dongia sp.]